MALELCETSPISHAAAAVGRETATSTREHRIVHMTIPP